VFLGDRELPEIRQRYRGYCEALEAAGIAIDERLVVDAPFDIEKARSAARCLPGLHPDFDAVFAASDMIALGAIATLQESGLAVPQDIAVVGFDDIPAAAHLYPGLTTVRQDIAEAGRTLVARLRSLLDDESAPSTRIDTRLVIRDTCGAGRAGR